MFNQDNLIKVGVYPRTSTEDQAERATIENQVDFAIKYCDLHQLPIVDWYKDDGVSGMIPLSDRPEGKRLLEDVKAGKINLVLVWKIDRIGRSARVILNGVHELEQAGAKIRSMTEPFDTSDASGRFLLTILAGVADLERSNILDRLWHGSNRAARAGKWLGGIVPYGYKVNEEKFLEVDEQKLSGFDVSEADVVRLIYNLTVEEKLTTIKIADYLNALHIPPSYVVDNRKLKRGKRIERTSGIWLPSRVRNMIVNSTYKGIHHYGKRTQKDRDIITRNVPAIVSEEVWDNAIKILKDHRLEATRNCKRYYLLRGLIKCSKCGLTYIGTAFPEYKKTLKPYYVCNGKTSYRGIYLGKCVSKNLPAEWIENIVWKDCLNFINNPGEVIEQLANSSVETKKSRQDVEKELGDIKRNIQITENETQKILDLYRKSFITDLEAESQLQSIKQEKIILTNRLHELEATLEDQNRQAEDTGSARELLSSLRECIQEDLPIEVKREIIKALVSKITVDTINEGGKLKANITIYYKFSKVNLSTDVRAATTATH